MVLPGLGEASLGPDPRIRRTPRLTQRCKKISPRSRSVRARPADPRSPDSFPSFCVSSQHGAGLPRLASRFYPGCRLLCGSPRLAKPLLPAAKVGRCRPLPVGRTAWRAGCGGSPPSNHFSLGAPGPYLPGAPVPRSHLRPTPVCGRLTCAEPIIPDPPAPPQATRDPSAPNLRPPPSQSPSPHSVLFCFSPLPASPRRRPWPCPPFRADCSSDAGAQRAKGLRPP